MRTRRMALGSEGLQNGWSSRFDIAITPWRLKQSKPLALRKGSCAHYTLTLFEAPAFLYFCNFVAAVLFEEDHGRARVALFCNFLRVHPCLGEHDDIVTLLEEAGGRAVQHYLPPLAFQNVGAPQDRVADICNLHHLPGQEARSLQYLLAYRDGAHIVEVCARHGRPMQFGQANIQHHCSKYTPLDLRAAIGPHQNLSCRSK